MGGLLAVLVFLSYSNIFAQADLKQVFLNSLLLPEPLKISFDFDSRVFQEKEQDPSVADIEEQLKTDPQNPHLLFLLARGYFRENKQFEAETLCLGIVKLLEAKSQQGKLTENDFLDWENALMTIGKPKEALKVAEKGIQEHTKSLLLHRDLVYLYLLNSFVAGLGIEDIQDLGAVLNAILDSATKGDKGAYDFFTSLKNSFQKAHFHAKQAIAHPKAQAFDFFTRAMIDWCLESIDLATKETTKGLTEEEEQRAQRGIFNLFGSEYFTKACQMKSDDPVIQSNYLMFRLLHEVGPETLEKDFQEMSKADQKRIKETRDKLLNLKNQETPCAKVYDALSIIFHIMKKKNQSLEMAQKALKIDPALHNAFGVVIRNHLFKEEFEKALEVAQKKAEEDHSEIAFKVIAIVDIKTGQYLLAEQAVLEAIKASSFLDPESIVILAIAFLNQGRVNEAIYALRSLYDPGQPDDLLIYTLGVAYYLGNQKIEALDCFLKLKEHPSKDQPYSSSLNQNVDRLIRLIETMPGLQARDSAIFYFFD